MRRVRAAATAVGTVAALLLAGCGGDRVRDPSEDVGFRPCSEVECAGRLLSGAEFDIIMPVTWNGTLAIYSHALVQPDARDDLDHTGEPAPTPQPEPTASATGTPSRQPSARRTPAPSRTPTPTASPRPGGPQLAPLWADGDQALVDAMLQAGYAVAGTAPTGQGWTVGAQMTSARELHDYFVATVGAPNRVYLWGESTGGLASARLAETDPDWVSGALAYCAPMSGPLQSFDLALDVQYAIRVLLLPNMRLGGYTSLRDAEVVRDRAISAVREKAVGTPAERAAVVFIAAIGALPNRSRTETGATLDSQIAANVDGIVELVQQSTVQRYLLEQLVGSNPSGNAGTDYSQRINIEQRVQIDSLVPGITDRMLATLAAGRRVTPDPAARERAREEGELTGDLSVPVLTLHNVYDPVYIVQNEAWFAAAVAATSPEAQGKLVNAFAFPPRTYSESVPADEGAGNCVFEPRTLFGGLLQLNRWVRAGEYPGRDSVGEIFKGQSVTLDFQPPPWPQMSATATDAGSTASPTSTSGRARAPARRGVAESGRRQ